MVDTRFKIWLIGSLAVFGWGLPIQHTKEKKLVPMQHKKDEKLEPKVMTVTQEKNDVHEEYGTEKPSCICYKCNGGKGYCSSGCGNGPPPCMPKPKPCCGEMFLGECTLWCEDCCFGAQPMTFSSGGPGATSGGFSNGPGSCLEKRVNGKCGLRK